MTGRHARRRRAGRHARRAGILAAVLAILLGGLITAPTANAEVMHLPICMENHAASNVPVVQAWNSWDTRTLMLGPPQRVPRAAGDGGPYP